MVKTKVSIPHVRWRDGRPRLSPGPHIRQLGIKGRDLRHVDGKWFTFEEAQAESERFVASLPKPNTTGKGPQNYRAKAISSTMGQLCEDLFKLPAFQGKVIQEGRRIRKGLSPKTVEGYQKCKRAVEKACLRMQQKASAKHRREVDSLWDLPAAAWTVPLCQALLNDIEIESGLHMVRACRAFLSQLWSRLGAKEPGAVKDLWQQMEYIPMPEGRVRPWEPAEFWHMMKTADEEGRPEMGDSFALGVSTALRQTDRLTFTVVNDTETHITGRQSKRGHLVTVKKTGLLARRLADAKKRRENQKVSWPHLVIDEKINRPFHEAGDFYRKVFAAIRDKAAETMPSCATLRDQDLKDTNQTWLDRAMVDERVLAMIAGHTESTFRSMQRKHYVAENQVKIDAAIDVIDAMLELKK